MSIFWQLTVKPTQVLSELWSTIAEACRKIVEMEGKSDYWTLYSIA